MSRFDFTERLNFNEIDLTSPDRVIGVINDDLIKATRGIVRIGIEPYDGIITEHKPSFVTNFVELFQKNSESFSVLPDMGKLGGEIHQYELYLFTPSYPSYKFRMMFLRFGLASYPAEIILEQGIAAIAGDEKGFVDVLVRVDNREQLETFIEKVLNTDYIIDVMQELIRVDQIQKYRSINNLKPIQLIEAEGNDDD